MSDFKEYTDKIFAHWVTQVPDVSTDYDEPNLDKTPPSKLPLVAVVDSAEQNDEGVHQQSTQRMEITFLYVRQEMDSGNRLKMWTDMDAVRDALNEDRTLTGSVEGLTVTEREVPQAIKARWLGIFVVQVRVGR